MRQACVSVPFRTASLALGLSLSRNMTTCAPADASTIRVVTYNVLSDALAQPDHFILCKPEDLDERTRYERLVIKLRKEMDKGAVICLQEVPGLTNGLQVSQRWSGRLIAEFASKGYTFACRGYGNRFNDYMGVGIAWPNAKFAPREVEIKRIADSAASWPVTPQPTPTAVTDGGLYSTVCGWFWSEDSKPAEPQSMGRPPITDPWKEAERRSNCAVLVRLEDLENQSEFCVASYHMPCLFGSDIKCQVMVIHAALLVEHSQCFARGSPLVVAGDFNIKPYDPTYAMIRDGKLSTDNPHWPKDGPNQWKLNAMRSAYDVCGGEPEFTNYANTHVDSPPFCEVLDYIWLSSHWHVGSVEQLTTKSGLKGIASFPSSLEPSDHVLLAANLCIPSELPSAL